MSKKDSCSRSLFQRSILLFWVVATVLSLLIFINFPNWRVTSLCSFYPFCSLCSVRKIPPLQDHNLNGKKSEIRHTSNNPAYPHIVLMLIDDQGYSDMGYHSIDLSQCTPNLDLMASQGIKLENYYSLHLCTPARASLLTGLYPIHNGMYHQLILPNQLMGLPLSYPILPSFLKQLGYDTHIIGKWHLGYFSVDYTPTARGFDSFYGYYNGDEFYLEHESTTKIYFDEHEKKYYYDFVLNNQVQFDAYGTLSTDLFEQRAKFLIENQDPSRPLFLYLPWQNVHGPLENLPSSYFTPEQLELLDTLEAQEGRNRRVFGEITISLDNSVGRVMQSLKDNGLYNNSVIIVASDNGGCPFDGGYNYPYRGNKDSLFEGGTHVNAFIHSPLLPSETQGQIYNNLFHVSDWFPTIISGILDRKDIISDLKLDGVNHWPVLTGQASYQPRTEMVYNIDPYDDTGYYKLVSRTLPFAAIRVGNYKYITGQNSLGWYWPRGMFGDDSFTTQTDDSIPDLTPGCDRNTSENSTFLFDLATDPYETSDLSEEKPEIIEFMQQRLNKYLETLVEVSWGPADYKAYVVWDANEHAICPWVV